MYKNRSRGFTLIELLVVIAIIGVLSAVVLASLNTARNKGNDAAIQSDMATIQTEAEIYYGSNTANPNSYGTQTSTTGSGASGYAACLNGVFSSGTIKKALQGADTVNGAGNISCYASTDGTAYLVAAQLTSPTPTSYYWCIDQTGAGRQVSGTLPSSLTACP